MARMTIEDCLKRVRNRYKLTLLATDRARELARGAYAAVDAGRDKPAVIALRELAANKLSDDLMRRYAE